MEHLKVEIEKTGPTVLDYFKYDHLPEKLQKISKPFSDLAHNIILNGGNYDETKMALRKLLEAKDCAVRAML